MSIGCQDAERERREAAKKNLEEARKALEQNSDDKVKSALNDDKSTHVIATDAVYYKGGPQQAQPPDGTFKAGTKVALCGSPPLSDIGGVKVYAAAAGAWSATAECGVGSWTL